jgi:sigma-B regulation protein RsbU (phosphoserine phosphatase)
LDAPDKRRLSLSLALLLAGIGMSGVLFGAYLYHSFFTLLYAVFALGIIGAGILILFFAGRSLAASVARQANEIESLRRLSRSGKKDGDIQVLFDQLLKSAIADTKSDAGWLSLDTPGEDSLLKTRNINIVQVSHISALLDAKQELINIPLIDDDEQLHIAARGYGCLLALNVAVSDKETLRLCLLKEEQNRFEPANIEILEAYISQARTAYENKRLTKETVQTERVKEEVEVARRIQQSLIPSSFPILDHVEIEAFFQPSREVGGDFYDYFEISDDRLGIVIGDVSGKGIPAALHMAEIKGIFQSLHEVQLGLKELIVKANSAIAKCFEKNVFVSALYVIIDKKERTFTYVRAGHCPILHYDIRTGNAGFIEDKGLGLGIIRNNTFSSHIHVYTKDFYAGDILVLYTDGIEEALGPKGNEPYGYERLKGSLEKAERKSAAEVKKTMLSDFRRYVKNNENQDDQAMIVLRFS